MALTPDNATWLRSPALTIAATPPGAGRWAGRGTTSEIVSPIALRAGAETEAARQAAFLAGPLARDRHLVPGQHRSLYGRLVRMRGDRLGYDTAGADVFVIGVREHQTLDVTELTVLKRLP